VIARNTGKVVVPDASDAAPVYADLASLGSDDEFGASITKVVASQLITHYVQVHEAPGLDANLRLVEQPHPPCAEEAQIRSAVPVQVAHGNGRAARCRPARDRRSLKPSGDAE